MSLSQESEGEAAACGGRNDGEGKCQISAWMSMLTFVPYRAQHWPRGGRGDRGPQASVRHLGQYGERGQPHGQHRCA